MTTKYKPSVHVVGGDIDEASLAEAKATSKAVVRSPIGSDTNSKGPIISDIRSSFNRYEALEVRAKP